jgi:hypothetical protein
MHPSWLQLIFAQLQMDLLCLKLGDLVAIGSYLVATARSVVISYTELQLA